MGDPGEFGRRLKFLRERDQVTMTRLAATTTMDKDRLKELEAGKAQPTAWERQRIAEVFDVALEYFTGDKGAGPAVAGRAGAGAAGTGGERAKRSGQTLDFSEFKYFKDEARPSSYDPNASGTVSVSDGVALASDLFDDSDSIEQQGAGGAAPPAAGAARGAEAPARGAPAGPPAAQGRAPAPAGRPGGGKAAASPHAKADYVDPFASFRAPGTPAAPTAAAAAGGRSKAPEQAEPVSERRGRGGKSTRQKKPAGPPPVPDASMTMGKAPGSRFAHSPGVTDDVVGASPAAEPPSRGFAATLHDSLQPPAPPAPGSLSVRRGPPRDAPRPAEPHRPQARAGEGKPLPEPLQPQALRSEAEAVLDATFGAAPPIPPTRHASPTTARYAPLPPDALARAAQEREAAVTGAIDPKQAALEALVYVKALTEVLLARGLLTGEELAKALRRARGE